MSSAIAIVGVLRRAAITSAAWALATSTLRCGSLIESTELKTTKVTTAAAATPATRVVRLEVRVKVRLEVVVEEEAAVAEKSVMVGSLGWCV
jgi:hypothetical protein